MKRVMSRRERHPSLPLHRRRVLSRPTRRPVAAEMDRSSRDLWFDLQEEWEEGLVSRSDLERARRNEAEGLCCCCCCCCLPKPRGRGGLLVCFLGRRLPELQEEQRARKEKCLIKPGNCYKLHPHSSTTSGGDTPRTRRLPPRPPLLQPDPGRGGGRRSGLLFSASSAEDKPTTISRISFFQRLILVLTGLMVENSSCVCGNADCRQMIRLRR